MSRNVASGNQKGIAGQSVWSVMRQANIRRFGAFVRSLSPQIRAFFLSEGDASCSILGVLCSGSVESMLCRLWQISTIQGIEYVVQVDQGIRISIETGAWSLTSSPASR